MYTPLVQLLNPKIRYMGDDKSFLALDTLRNTYVLAIHIMNLSRESRDKHFPKYPIAEFNVGHKVLVQ